MGTTGKPTPCSMHGTGLTRIPTGCRAAKGLTIRPRCWLINWSGSLLRRLGKNACLTYLTAFASEHSRPIESDQLVQFVLSQKIRRLLHRQLKYYLRKRNIVMRKGLTEKGAALGLKVNKLIADRRKKLMEKLQHQILSSCGCYWKVQITGETCIWLWHSQWN